MKNRISAFVVLFSAVATSNLFGQNQWFTNGLGQSFLDNAYNGGTPIRQISIGTGPNLNTTWSNLNVFSGQDNQDNFNIAEFHSSANNRGFLRWYRGPGNGSQMGRIYFNDANNLGFNIQATQQGGTLWGRNRANLGALDIYGNGWRLIDDVNFNANGYANNPRVGYMALGHAATMDVNSASYALPISRFTLVHATAPDATAVSSAQVSSAIAGYRPWMRNMITLVGNGNLGFVGQKFLMSGSTETSDSTDVVIGTSDDNLPANTSRYGNISFRYTTTPGAANVGSAGTLESLETMRIRHARTSSTDPIQGFVGIGDWINTAGSPVPDERLDILDRTARIRQLPSNTYFAPDADDDKIVVVRSDGRLNWRTLPGGGGSDCDWDPAIGNIATAYRPSSAAPCPEEDNSVLIGYDPAAMPFPVGDSKVWIHTRSGDNPTTFQRGVFVDAVAREGTGYVVGVNAEARNDGPNRGVYHYGVATTAHNAAHLNHGVEANAYMDDGVTANTGKNLGVHAQARISSGNSTPYNAGVFVESRTDGTVGVHDLNYGVNSETYHFGTGSMDQNVAVRAVTNVSSTAGLNYNIGVIGSSRLPSGTTVNVGNYGVWGVATSPDAPTVCYAVRGDPGGPDNGAIFTKWAGYFAGNTYSPTMSWTASDEQLKQNIEDLPDDQAVVILSALQPKRYDFRHEELAFLNLPYEHQFGLLAQEVEGLLPQCVRTIHQPAEFDSLGTMIHPDIDFRALNYQSFIPLLIAGFKAQQATIASLQDQINGCCANVAPADQHSMNTGTADIATERLLISPNPFTDHTTVKYYVPQAARISLQVSDSMGKPVSTLREEQAMAGSFTYEWNTQSLAPGNYFVALLADGNVVVKKAVKVGER